MTKTKQESDRPDKKKKPKQSKTVEAPNAAHSTPEQDATMSPPHEPVQLPTEIVDHIISFLKANDDLPALAAMARVNQDMYDLTIPKLYDSITINERNKQHIEFGHSFSPMELRNGCEPIKHSLTRKDIAVSYTRKLIFDGPPNFGISEHYRAVEEVILTARCTGEAFSSNNGGFSDIRRDLVRLASKYPKISPLCLTVHMRRSLRCRIILNHLFFNFPAVPITCEFHYMSLGKATGSHSLAYDLGAVVHVAEEDSEEDVDLLAVKLAAQLVETFLYQEEEDMDEDNVPPGQIFLCDVPRSVLSHKELSESEDAVNTARLKLFNLCDFGRLRRNFTEPQRWSYFTRRVKLVDPGFKPSQADIAASVKRREYFHGE